MRNGGEWRRRPETVRFRGRPHQSRTAGSRGRSPGGAIFRATSHGRVRDRRAPNRRTGPSVQVRRNLSEMQFLSSSLAVLAVTTALAGAAPVANAQPFPGAAGGGAALGPCGNLSSGPDSGLSGVQNENCVGSALIFNGPAVGRIGVVIGPTIITPGAVGAVAVSEGSIFM